MKAFWQAHKKALRRGLLVLLLVWAVWYARPLDVYDLMGGEPPEYLQISIFPQFQFPEVLNDSLVFAAGDPETRCWNGWRTSGFTETPWK